MSALENVKTTELGIEASVIKLNKLTKTPIPENSPYGIPVLNKQGYEKVSPNEYTDSFVRSALNAEKPLLEIGAAFGHAVHRVLDNGGRITACDMGKEHLEIVIRQTKKEHLKNLYVYPGKFPEEVVFPPETFSAILAARVLHFIEGYRLEVGLKKIYDWLIPEGKFYYTGVSIYHDTIREGFLPTYKENVKNGLRWCGEIEDQLKYAPQHSQYAPSFMHVFDVPEIEKILPEFGFKIEKISLFRYPDDLSSGDKGHIGFIATKI